MNIEQERAEFEAWHEEKYYWAPLFEDELGLFIPRVVQNRWEAYQAGRAALQSQSMPSEISRDLLGKIVDEVFDGAIEDASVIEDIYRVVARECALQSRDREDAEWMKCESRRPWVTNSLKHHAQELRAAEKRSRRAFNKDYMGEPARYFADACGEAAAVFEARLSAIDRARRVEGEGE